ncbi:MAG TPA: hypothetical protein VL992_20270 [Tepidisphaeraceae bacterium]|nr:hypothetical protein [Tepidisphaeraceae bacterium]
MKIRIATLALAIGIIFVTYRRSAAQSAPATRPSPAIAQNNGSGDDRQERRERRRREEEGGYRRQSLQQAQGFEAYSVLQNRSIFFKGRFVPAPPPGAQVQFTPPPSQNITFNGVAVTDYDHSKIIGAWLENNDDESVQIVHAGDIVRGGQISKIDIATNTLDYTINGHTRTVSIGENLAGEQVFGVNSGTSSTSSQPTVDLSGPNADILKRLMARRQAELNGGK